MPYTFRWPGLARPSEDHPEPPPRPQAQERPPGTDTVIRAAMMGPLDAEFDPCGAGPIKSSDEGEAA